MGKPLFADSTFQKRLASVRGLMKDRGLKAIIVPSGGELAWLCGHGATSHDQSYFLVIKAEEELATLVISGLELPAVTLRPEVFTVSKFGIGTAATRQSALIGALVRLTEFFFGVIGVGGELWAETLIPLQEALPGAKWKVGSAIVGELRRLKDQEELRALSAVAAAVDATVADIQRGAIKLRGRTEKAVAFDVARLLLEHGHDKVDFTIIAYGANAADPHHEPDDTVIGTGPVLFDIGGTMDGYCSDTTRMVHVGQPTEEVAAAYECLRQAQQAAVAAVRPGITGKALDAVPRGIIESAGYPGYEHGLSHGIGRQTHEPPRASLKSEDVLQLHDVISVEPGIYIAGAYGMRIEDIVVVTEEGCEPLNKTDHRLIIVEP